MKKKKVKKSKANQQLFNEQVRLRTTNEFVPPASSQPSQSFAVSSNDGAVEPNTRSRRSRVSALTGDAALQAGQVTEAKLSLSHSTTHKSEGSSAMSKRLMRKRPFVKQRTTRSGSGKESRQLLPPNRPHQGVSKLASRKRELDSLPDREGALLSQSKNGKAGNIRVTSKLPVITGVETLEQHKARLGDRRRFPISLPHELSQLLVRDHDSIIRSGKLSSLPAAVSVNSILNRYHSDKLNNQMSGATRATFDSFVSGLRDYFNEMLGTKLLYDVEREQFAELLRSHAQKPVSELFGARHFLRLLCKLSDVLGMSEMRVEQAARVTCLIDDFMQYLLDNITLYFPTHDYV